MDSAPREVFIVGATGSIGKQAQDILRRYRQKFRLVGVSVHRNLEGLQEILREFPEVRTIVITDAGRGKEVDEVLVRSRNSYEILVGYEGLEEALESTSASTILMAMNRGIFGIRAVLRALQRGKRIALASKEILVCAGELVMEAVQRYREKGAALLPVDSEHSALFQCIAGESASCVEKVVLTASGGPFYRWTQKEMAKARVEDALAHPRWKMGAKITVDSATLMNKGLEVIEAVYLFGLAPEQVEVWVHPQAIVHGLVFFRDGSVKAQLSLPDMRIPIALALIYPDARLSFSSLEISRLTPEILAQCEFEYPDRKKFPLLELAYQAIQAGGDRPCVLNAGNDVAVEAFLSRQIGFLDIAMVVQETLAGISPASIQDVEDVYTRYEEGVQYARQVVRKIQRGFLPSTRK